jgi:DMSO/TMAO reductase YedYZ molybdopterin-dependent catalytic subunit
MFTKLLIASVLVLALLGLVACGQSPETTDTTVGAGPVTSATVPGSSTTVPTTSTSELEPLEPIVVPTLPEVIPDYTDVDPATGLHMTGTPQVIDLADYRLKVSGMVTQELSLAYDDLRRMPKMTATPTLVCPGFFEDTTTWSGVPLYEILEMAGVQPDAKRITLTAADGYGTSLSLEEALKPANFLAYEWMGQPLPVLHGFPLRAVFPDRYGSYWVKWLVEIEVA